MTYQGLSVYFMHSIHCRFYTPRRREENACRCVWGPSRDVHYKVKCFVVCKYRDAVLTVRRHVQRDTFCSLLVSCLYCLKCKSRGRHVHSVAVFFFHREWLASLPVDSSCGICGVQSAVRRVVLPAILPSPVHNYSKSVLHSFVYQPWNGQWAHLGYIWARFHHWVDQDVDEGIILRWILRKWEGVVGTGWS